MAWAAACGSSGADPSSRHAGDASFGNGAADLPRDAGGPGDGGAGSNGGDSSGSSAQLRLVHALPNVGPLHVCYDPDLVADDPATAVSELVEGAKPAVQLALAAPFGEATSYAAVMEARTGALTFHSASAVTEQVDAGVADAGTALDAGAMLSACDARTRVAVLPLPFPASRLDPLAPPSLDALSLTDRIARGDRLTLLASGLALDGFALAARAESVRVAYLDAHPGDTAGARSAAQELLASLWAGFGPLVVLATELPASASSKVSLSVAHLVPDVPSQGSSSGAIRLCITADRAEGTALPDAGRSGFRFRTRTLASADVSPRANLDVRVFAAEAFDAEAKGCAATSLAPIAARSIRAGELRAGRSYTLAVVGVIAPDALCSGTSPDALARLPCAASPAALAAHIDVLAD